MIKIWKQNKSNLIRTAILEKHCWIEVTNPDTLEIETLKRDYGISDDIILDVLDLDERPRCEKDDSHFGIIIRMPVWEKESKIPYTTIPLGIIITRSVVITITKKEISLLGEMVEKHLFYGTLDNPKHFVLLLLLYTANKYLSFLKEINRDSTHIENELQRSIKNTELVRLLRLEKSLVYFTTSLRGNEFMIERLQRIFFHDLGEDLQEILDDVIIESKQALEVANIYSNILSGMMDAFASVISNNLNIIMKRLTMISIIIMIPTLFASLYGMNVTFPWGNSPFAFIGILGISVVCAIGGVFVFLSKRLFRS